MKKVLITIIVFLFTSIATSYAGIFQRQSEDNSSDRVGSFYDSTVNYSEETVNREDSGGFFRSSSADNPGGRPDNGGGIGQESAPIHDGLPVLITCCIVFGFVKTFKEKTEKRLSRV